MMILKSKRLFIRKLKLEDLNDLHRLQSNPNVMKYIIHRAKTKNETEEELKKIIRFDKENRNDFVVLAVCKNESDEMIGTCAIIKNEKNEYEIGYRLVEEEWGNGYGSELTKLIATYCSTIRKINFIVASVEAKNTNSVSILEKNGFNLIDEILDAEIEDTIKYYRKDLHTY
jgi:[ribosomal protein S5]-alanine N-acetyltransferase